MNIVAAVIREQYGKQIKIKELIVLAFGGSRRRPIGATLASFGRPSILSKSEEGAGYIF